MTKIHQRLRDARAKKDDVTAKVLTALRDPTSPIGVFNGADTPVFIPGQPPHAATTTDYAIALRRAQNPDTIISTYTIDTPRGRMTVTEAVRR